MMMLALKLNFAVYDPDFLLNYLIIFEGISWNANLYAAVA